MSAWTVGHRTVLGIAGSARQEFGHFTHIWAITSDRHGKVWEIQLYTDLWKFLWVQNVITADSDTNKDNLSYIYSIGRYLF